MVTTLVHRDKGDENDIDIYTNTSLQQSPTTTQPTSFDVCPRDEGEMMEERRCRDIVLRNMMMDMILSLLSPAHMELDTRCVWESVCVCVCVCVWVGGCASVWVWVACVGRWVWVGVNVCLCV